MEAKPSKCCTLAMKKFDHRYINKSFTPLSNRRYSHYDPNLFLSGERITPIADEGFKYLGVRIEWTLQEKQSRGRIKEILINLINLVNNTHVANTAKLWLYNHHIVPRLSWWFTTLDLSLSFAKHLHSLVLPFLKKWCGLPRAANPSILFCGSKSRPGLRLKRIPTVWKQSRASMLQLLKYSRDTRVRSVFKGKLEVEEKRLPGNNKYAPCIELECAEASVPHSEIQRPHLAGLGYNVMHASTYNLESVRKFRYIHDVDVTQQLTHLSSLQMQGCWNQWDNIMNTDFSWNKLIYGTSDGVLRFLLISTTNT